MKLTNQQMYLLLSALYSLQRTRALKRLPETSLDLLREQSRHLRDLVLLSGHKIPPEAFMHYVRLFEEVKRFKELAEAELFCVHGSTPKASCPLCTP